MSYDSALEALADPTRRRVLDVLRDGPMPVGAVAEKLPVSRPAVSKHLRVLERAGLVSHRSQGAQNVYRLEPDGIADLRDWMDAWWDEPLRRYAAHVGGGAAE